MSESAVALLEEEVRRRLRRQGDWPLDQVADLLIAAIGQNPSLMLSLTVAAVLELSRNQNSTGSPTTSGTCESICENGGPEKPSEMVERVARALYECPGSSFLAKIDMVEPAWEALRYEYKDHFRVNARAAIEAMYEPTEAMIDAADEKRWIGAIDYGPSIEFNASPADAWRAMIDAALHPQK